MTIVIDSLTDVGVVIVTPPELLKTKVGEGYGYSLSSAGGSGIGYTYELVDPNALPEGLTLLPNGVIQGEPMPGSAGFPTCAARYGMESRVPVDRRVEVGSLKLNEHFMVWREP